MLSVGVSGELVGRRRLFGYTAPAGRGRRELVAREFGHLYHWRERGVWVVDVRPYGRIFEIPMGDASLRFTRKVYAQDVLASIRSRIAEGTPKEVAVAPYLPRSQAQVQRRVQAWLELLRRQVQAGERSPTYLRELERYARPDGHFSYLAEVSIHEVNYGALEDWIGWLSERGIGPRTRAHVVSAFRTFLGWLYKRDELERLPKIPPTSYPRPAPMVISTDAQELILEEIPEPCRGAFIASVELLVRPGEVRALNVSDYSWPSRKLTVSAAMKGAHSDAPRRETKEGDVRRHVVSDRLADWLERYVSKPERLEGSRPLFVNPRSTKGGLRWLQKSLRLEWNRAARAVGLSVKMYEGTKHSTATALRKAGVPLDVIQAACGHRDQRSTEVYARLEDSAVVEALKRRRS